MTPVYHLSLDLGHYQKLFLEKIPFIVISLILGVVTLNIRQDVVPPVQYNLLDRFIVFCSAMVDYFARLLFPFQLSMTYAYPAKEGGFLPPLLYLSPFILILIGWGLYKLGIPKKILIIGLLFFFINIFLSQSVLLIDNYKASRYVYLSYIGLFFILGSFTDQVLTASDGWRSKLKFGWVGLLIVLVAGFSYLTYSRNFLWKDTITLFDDVVAKQPGIPWVYSNRGIAKYKNNDYDGALQDFNHALELDPNFTLSLFYRGLLNNISGNYQAALDDLNRAIVNYPEFSDAFKERGKSKMALQDNQGALDDFSKAIELNPYFVEAYANRGALKYNLADYQGALTDFSKTIELDSGYAYGFYMRSLVEANLNNLTGSCDDAQQALSLGYPDASQQVEVSCQ